MRLSKHHPERLRVLAGGSEGEFLPARTRTTEIKVHEQRSKFNDLSVGLGGSFRSAASILATLVLITQTCK